jgi:hypothetical protein
VVALVATCRRNPDIQDAVASLARHLCLRAPDKADNRAAAIKAAAELVVELPQWEQEQFVGFVFALSRTKQVGHCCLWGCPAPVLTPSFAPCTTSGAWSSEQYQWKCCTIGVQAPLFQLSSV